MFKETKQLRAHAQTESSPPFRLCRLPLVEISRTTSIFRQTKQRPRSSGIVRY